VLYPPYLRCTRKQLRQLRVKLGYTCKDLGALDGLHGSTVSKIEQGTLQLTEKTAKALAKALEKARKDPRPGPEVIRTRRIRLKLTQEQLADRAGVSVGTICQIERGNSVGLRSQRTIKRLVDALDELERDPLATPAAFGRQLKSRRIQAGLDKKEFAKLAEFDEGTIRRIESGEQSDLQTREKLLEVLETVEKEGPVTPLAKVRAVRYVLRVTQKELAKKARLHDRTVRAAECGEPIKPASHAKIHKALKELAQERKVDPKKLLIALAAEDAPKLPSGEAIRQKREARKMSRPELARRVGISRGSMRLIEIEKCRPRIPTARAIERVLEEERNGAAKPNGHTRTRLYPLASKNAKARLRKRKKVGTPKRQRGRPVKKQTQEINGLCYQGFVVDRQPARTVMHEVNRRFPERYISEEKNVREYARRFATKHGLPWRVESGTQN
jgi:transcriptional regulator with XRE-family HTH domain